LNYFFKTSAFKNTKPSTYDYRKVNRPAKIDAL
jgi:hypothetical protein